MYFILALPISLLVLLLLHTFKGKLTSILPYLFFFVGPVLTYFGVIGVLTGFNANGSNSIYFGISFYTVFIAYQISKFRSLLLRSPLKFVISVLNPLYLFTGPIPNSLKYLSQNLTFKKTIRRLATVNADLILGVLFSSVLAPSFKPFFYLKQSTEILDIILFGIIFEFYVYFNFAGFSMIAWSLMRLFGISVQRNFRQPFGATSIVEYWQRWHISLSNILKELFFVMLKPVIGIYTTVFIVFIASAIWHGVSANFAIWGLFHASLWCIAYYSYKQKFKIFNYILLIFGVIIGRVIFSEIDLAFLWLKIQSLINIFQWSLNSEFVMPQISLVSGCNLIMALVLIGFEVLLPRLGFLNNNYCHLKTPVVSSLILLYTCLVFTGLGGAPIYGNR